MRFILFRIGIYLGLAVLLGGLFHTQVIHGRYYHTLGDKNRIRLIPLEAPRGRVYDRHGKLLAANRAAYDLVVTPEDMDRDTVPTLAKLLKTPESDIRARLKAPREYPFAPAVVREDISRELAFHIEEHRSELAGVEIQVTGLRHYPFGTAGSHVIGFIGKINQEEYAANRENQDQFGLNSTIGRAGIEKIYDRDLRGWRGGRQIEVNARGKMIRLLNERDPEAGRDLTVTLDMELQQTVMDLIGPRNASVMMLDLESEEFLVLASTPAFDPNAFVSPASLKQRIAYLNDKASPLVDRGVSSAYPPGSVFKLVTALAGLDSGKITTQSHFFCSGQYRLTPNSVPRKCWFARGHGNVGVYQALERSCNVFFYNVGKKLSADQISDYAHRLGLGEIVPIEATNITAGLVPNSDWKRKQFKEKWYQGETLSFAIGQSYLLTSPLQILRMTSIIAKDGDWVEPRLVRSVNARKKDKRKVNIKKQDIEIVKKGMLQVVQSNYGTGQLARVDFGEIAAKTGTAQAPPKNSHAWMTGFFPYENPRVAFVVFVEHGGSGGVASAGIVKGMLQKWQGDYVQEVA